MRKLIIVTATILLLGSIPATSAKHLSVGVQDGVGLGPDETPDDPSVVGEAKGAEDTPYGIGTQTDCYEAEGHTDPDDPGGSAEDTAAEGQEATSSDSLCGEFVYHNGTPIEVTSPPDQTLFDPIDEFDVIHTRSYRTMTYTGVAADVIGAETGEQFSYCHPMCPDGSTTQPVGGDTVFDVFHNAAAQLGLTESAEDAREGAGDDRGQQYNVNLFVPGPGVTAQEEAGIWSMNGWMVPWVENTFIAYPQDGEGNIITEQRLNDIVQQKKDDGELHPDTAARICAYSPDIELTTVAPGAAGTRCELPFRFQGEPQEDDGGAMFDGYDDRCASPTYVCGAANGPAWYAEFCLCLGFMNPALPGASPVIGGDNVFLGDEGSQTDYHRWHHIIAPHDSECGGAQEPTAALETGFASEDKPFLAHDLDVYVPAWTASNVDDSRGVQHAFDYVDAVVDDGLQTALDETEDAQSLLGELPGTPSDAQNASYLVAKEDKVEPNLAQPVKGLDDTSRQLETGDSLERDFEDFCEQFLSNEDDTTVDDWVDYIDSQVVRTGDVQLGGITPFNDQTFLDLYVNEDRSQDTSNRPGPGLYATSGNVGMFTDKDDDGAYEPADGGIKYEGKTVQEQGAYPMMWDMVVEDDGTPDLDGGCAPSDDVNLVDAMVQLGYGADTGLVQAIYLNEPTAFVNEETGNAVPYPDGQNVYLLMSQAARQKYLADEDPIASKIDSLVGSLSQYAADQNDELSASDVGLEMPARELGFDKGFEDQCNGPSGNFDSLVGFTHSCQVDCSGDTIATMYTFELTDPDGQLQGAQLLPGFFGSGDDAYAFGGGQHTWYDIDPFDNDPDRNEERQAPPPTGD